MTWEQEITINPAEPAPDAEEEETLQRAEQIACLLDLFIAEKGQGLSRRFLSHLSKSDIWDFDPDDVQAALSIIDDADPELRRLRALVRCAADTHSGRYRHAALKFAKQAIASETTGSLFPIPSYNARRRLESVGQELAPRLVEGGADGRRAFNVLMLAVDLLASEASLTPDDAIPALRSLLRTPDEPPRQGVNPRLERIAQLTDPNLTADRLRQVLDLVLPWEERAANAAADRDRAVSQRETALGQLRGTQAEAVRLDIRIRDLEQELGIARQQQGSLRDQLRDAGSLGQSDVAAMRAHTLSFLEGRLLPTLDTAREAGDEQAGPRTKVMRRMITDALHDLQKEIAWLKSSG